MAAEEGGLTRRRFLRLAAASAALTATARAGAQEKASMTKSSTDAPASMMARTIPRTGEAIPVIGLGTWQTFDVGTSAKERDPLDEVLRRFLAAGGRVIDSSPMYGQAEQVTGDEVAAIGAAGKPFLATKVWTSGKASGKQQIDRSFSRLGAKKLDLLQIHNLLDWQTHLPYLRELKQAGRIRYIGITHYAHSAFAELEALMRKEKLDFVQLPYNLADRTAEARLLPAAAETGTAVLVMRPFEEGAHFKRVKGLALPGWAKDIDCTSWAQVFLKFILGHPAVTCPIPATSSPEHLADNVLAGRGRLPDEALRQRMVKDLGL
jgi:aryl-alcohol dehydrogenase-like predicted oxidoreductase